MKNKIYSFCAIAFLACMFLFLTPSKCEAQTFIGKLERIWPNGQPLNGVDISDGSTITIIVINGWGGQKKVEGFVQLASGNEIKTSLLTIDRYDSSVISGTNGEYSRYAFESAVIFLRDKTLTISVAGTSYMGTITEVK
jgi:hypothetical protein